MRSIVVIPLFILLISSRRVSSQGDANPQTSDDNNQDLLGQSDGTEIDTTAIQVNELPPRFTNFERTTRVQENSIQFSPPITVRAVDPENTMITYKIESGDITNAFTIHPTNGILGLTHPLAYQTTPEGNGRFNITISATDSGIPKRESRVNINVIIIDKNDNRPVFFSKQYVADIKELAGPGTRITTVRASDKDFGANSEIIYELQGSDKFTINPRNGVISVSPSANLDIDEFGNTYHLTALAKDQGSPQMTGSAMVTIYISDSNNHPPRFRQNTYTVTLLDGSSIGTTVALVRAFDSDSNADINYSVMSTTPSRFQSAFGLNRMTGEVTTQRPLDKENIDEVVLMIRAEDMNAESPVRPQTATATLRILLQSVGEDTVEFSPPWTKANPVYNIEIPEDTPVGRSVYILRATDSSDAENVMSFTKARDSDMGNYFAVQQSTGIVTLNRPLDYDSMMGRELQMQVTARTSSFPYKLAVTTMVFTVTDVNDNPPMFEQQAYMFRVDELQRYPKEIGTISATDMDSGIYGQVYYSLSGDGQQKFYLDKISGKLVVASNQTLDADVRSSYDLIVTASDSEDGNGRQATASVRIEVDDVNDNSPQFSSAVYTTYNQEETIPTGVSLAQVSASDKDATFGTVTYSISSGNSLGLFTIDSQTGVIRASRDLTPYVRSDPYRLSVKAYDNDVSPKSVETRVDIYLIQSANITSLSFIVPTKDRTVQPIKEGLPDGTVVMTVTARDNSPDATGNIIYMLESETDTFRLNRTTGVLTTRMKLDWEERRVYELILVAQVQGQDQKETRRILVVNVTDVDDETPRYQGCRDVNYGNPHVVNLDSMKVGDTVIDAKACDYDSPPFSIIRYSIVCGNTPVQDTQGIRPFKIDTNTGKLTSEIDIDRRITFQVCIKASSGGDSDSLVQEEVNFSAGSVVRNQGILRLNINIGGGTFRPPSFGSSNRTFAATINSKAPFHSEVIQIVSDRAGVAYSLLNIRFSRGGSSNDFFIIDRDDGTIYTNREHFREYLDGNFTMEVDIITQDGESIKPSVGVVVYVIPDIGILRLTFNTPLETFAPQEEVFENMASSALGSSQRQVSVITTGLRYALTGNSVTSDKFDYCFHIRDGNSVYTYDRAKELLDSKAQAMRQIYDDLKLGQPEELGTCIDIEATTAYWSDHWYLWWIIIAIGIALGLFILLTIIWICVCYYWSRNKVKTVKPFLMLDTMTMSRDQLEWQEQTVKMS